MEEIVNPIIQMRKERSRRFIRGCECDSTIGDYCSQTGMSYVDIETYVTDSTPQPLNQMELVVLIEYGIKNNLINKN